MSINSMLITDPTFSREIQTRLAHAPQLRAAALDVTVSDGIVMLAGTVATLAEKWAAEREVLTVSGVRAVVNTIHVHLPGIEERSDREIAEAVLDALARLDGATELHVTPIVSDGWVTLDGDVQTPAQKAAVRRIVAMILGVKGVTDKLTINAEASPVRIIAQIKEALQRACPEDGQAIDVELRDHTVILRGHVRSEAEIDEAEWVAWAPRGVEHVENRLELDTMQPA